MHTATKIELRDVGTIKPYEKNAKRHPKEQIEKLAAIIKRHGFDQPIVVDEHGVIIKGHGRLLASKQLGLKKVPVLVRGDLSPAQVREARIADNRVSEFGWDFEALVADVKDSALLDGFDLTMTSFELKELGLLSETKEVSFQIKQGAQEIQMDEAEHKCPRCGFGFDG